MKAIMEVSDGSNIIYSLKINFWGNIESILKFSLGGVGGKGRVKV